MHVLRLVSRAVIWLALTSCGDGGEAPCTTGASRVCACAVAPQQGVQQCAAGSWGACLGCDVPPGTPTSCSPNASEPCSCTDGTQGVRFCQLDGRTWSACGSCGASTPGTPGTPICTPNTSGPCSCTDGTQGAQICAADGLSWGACSCGTSQVCTPSSTEPCDCGYNKTGRHTCAADGLSWGTCTDCVSTAGPTESDCGDQGLKCQQQTEICVLKTAFNFEYVCEPLPSGCDADRSCACVSSVCSGIYDTCKEWQADNTVACDCSDCDK